MVIFLSVLLLLSSGANSAQREHVVANRRARQIIHNSPTQDFDPVVAAYQGSSTSQNQYFNAYSPAPDYRTVIQDPLQYSDQTYPYNGYSYYQPQEDQNYLVSPYNKPYVAQNSEESYRNSDDSYKSTIALINVFGDDKYNNVNNEHTFVESSDFSQTYSDQSINTLREPHQSEVKGDLQIVPDSSTINKQSDEVRELTPRTKAQPFVNKELVLQNKNTNTASKQAKSRSRSNSKRQRRRLKVARKRGGNGTKARKAVGQTDIQENSLTSPTGLSSFDLARDTRSEQHRFERPRLDVGRESSKSTILPKSEPLTTPSRSRTRSRSRSRQRARPNPSRNKKDFASLSLASRKQEPKLSTSLSRDRFRGKQQLRPTEQNRGKKK